MVLSAFGSLGAKRMNEMVAELFCMEKEAGFPFHHVHATGGFGSNGLAGVGGSVIAGLLVEVVLTYVFVLVILGVTSKNAGHGSFGGLIIGWTLTLIHIFGIALTGTSVNPARSFGPAVVAAIAGNTEPIACLWIFIVAPLAGAALAAVTYKALEK